MTSSQKPQVLSRRIIYESPWVNLYVDHVRFPSGVEVREHHLIDCPRPSVLALVSDSAGRLLMVQVPRYPNGRTEWEFPAGRIDPGETIAAAAAREVLEESGYTTAGHELLYSYNPLNGSSTKVFHVVRCQALEQAGKFDRGEVSAVRWFTQPEIWEMVRSGEMMDGYTLTAFLLSQHLP